MTAQPATDQSDSSPRGSRLAAYLTVAYLVLIIYASLIPFTGWRDPGTDVWSFLFAPWSRHVRRFDVIINLFAYLPFGFLLCFALQSRCTARSALIAATFAGVVTSLMMESAQMYLPVRTSSTLDVLSNGLGCCAGAVIAARATGRRLIADLALLRDRWFIPGSLGDLGLVLLGLWFVSQLNPSLPLLGIVFIEENGSPFMRGFSLPGTLSVMCNLVGVSLLLMLLMRTAKAALIAILVLLLTASMIKLLAAAVLLKSQALLQWLTAESVIGIGYGLFIVAVSLLLTLRRVILLCAFSLAAGIFISHLHRGDAHSALTLFSWHYGHLLDFTGLAQIVAQLWPFVALGYLCLFVQKLRAQIRHRV